MKYCSTFEMAEKWGISPRRILNLIKNGRIPEAELRSSRWMIPENAKKPADARRKSVREEMRQDSDTFRFPLFEFKDESSFHPPLSEDERTVKACTEAVNACRFKDARRILGDLPERAENRYTRIAALYCGCVINIADCDTKRFLDCYGKLKAELQEDFPHKAEMSEYIHGVDALLGEDAYYASRFSSCSFFGCDKSFLPRLCNLSALRLTYRIQEMTAADLNTCEIYCGFLEDTDNYFDLQAVHVYLACAYGALGKDEECVFHFRYALQLAARYELFFPLAVMHYSYPPNMLNKALEDFPNDFRQKILQHNSEFYHANMRFTNAMELNSIYKLLEGNDYLYVIFAVNGLTNKEVAARMGIRTGTVGKRYGNIYAKLGVTNKTELVALYLAYTRPLQESSPCSRMDADTNSAK